MTNIRVTDISNSDVKINKRWKELSILWDKITKLQARNLRLEEKVSTFYEEAKKNIEIHEVETCTLISLRLKQLIGFISRKTIKGERREALYDLIHDELVKLETNPFWIEKTTDLRDLFHSEMMSEAQYQINKAPHPDESEIDTFHQMIEDMLGFDIDIEHEKLLEMMLNPQKMKQYIDEIYDTYQQQQFDDGSSIDDEELDDFLEEHELDHNDLDDDFFEDDFDFHNKTSGQSTSIENINTLLKTSDIKKLYKKIANKLHPDKESNECLRNEKNKLMQQLSIAKQEGDIFTLLQIGQKWLPEFELDLSPKALKIIITMLEEKVRVLNIEHQDIRSNTSLKTVIWNKFSARSKKQQQTNFQKHIASLTACQLEIQESMCSLSTVKAVNAYLKEKVEENNWDFEPFQFN